MWSAPAGGSDSAGDANDVLGCELRQPAGLEKNRSLVSMTNPASTMACSVSRVR